MRENRMSKLRQAELPGSVFVQHLTDHAGWRMDKRVLCEGGKLSEVMPQNPKGPECFCQRIFNTHCENM